MKITEKWNDRMKFDAFSGYDGKNDSPRYHQETETTLTIDDKLCH